jgi:UDP-N-acetylglucosamine 2-epimerase (non-hydrolysing)
MTIVGTRPEIIRLSRIVARFEQSAEHVLVHTGQNYDFELNDVFFCDLNIRKPDFFLEADPTSLGSTLADVLRGTERVIGEVSPNAVVVLGDTNSCISALMARRMRVPVYHLEAGNRSFDPNVPEEINRHLIDHVADYNLAYSEHARRNLLSEGIHPNRILLMGSPMREVLDYYRKAIEGSDVHERLELTAGGYFVASLHREENVDDPVRLERALDALEAVSAEYGQTVLVSTHPRTRKRIKEFGLVERRGLVYHPPLGFLDYVRLQQRSRCVLSDSGTVSEESAILGFPAITLRDAIERPEAIDTAGMITAGIDALDILDSLKITLLQWQQHGAPSSPLEYQITDSSRRVVNVVRSTAHSNHSRAGIRGR